MGKSVSRPCWSQSQSRSSSSSSLLPCMPPVVVVEAQAVQPTAVTQVAAAVLLVLLPLGWVVDISLELMSSAHHRQWVRLRHERCPSNRHPSNRPEQQEQQEQQEQVLGHLNFRWRHHHLLQDRRCSHHQGSPVVVD